MIEEWEPPGGPQARKRRAACQCSPSGLLIKSNGGTAPEIVRRISSPLPTHSCNQGINQHGFPIVGDAEGATLLYVHCIRLFQQAPSLTGFFRVIDPLGAEWAIIAALSIRGPALR